jgi:hypothetical protein
MRSAPVTHTYLVPVRESKSGALSLRTGRLVTGERVGMAFTSEASLLMTLGPSQQWIELAPGALRAMLAPLGVTCLRVDPRPVAELAAQTVPGEQLPGPVAVRRPALPLAS